MTQSPCCRPAGGDQSHCHLLTKHFLKHSGNASEQGEAVRVLALEREHECINGDCQWVGPPRHIRPDLKRETNEQNKRSCKWSCATELQVWCSVEQASFRLQFQCGEDLSWGGRRMTFSNKWLCLFARKQSATSLSFVLFIYSPIKVRPNNRATGCPELRRGPMSVCSTGGQ